jgi:hypothetical protein
MAQGENSNECELNDYLYELNDIEQDSHSVESADEELSKTPDGLYTMNTYAS